MTSSQKPIFYSQIKCPVCEAVNAHANVRANAYRYTGKDTDYCPTGFVWSDPEYQRFDPLLFSMATCQRCLYTREFTTEFREWEKDQSFNTYFRSKIKEKHLTSLRDAGGLLQAIGPRIDIEHAPIESAIVKFSLGIFDERLTEYPSAMSLARFFLRIAWLYRTHSEGDTLANFKPFLKEAGRPVSELPTTEAEALTQALEHYKKAYDTDSQLKEGMAQAQATYLIAELSRRVGDFKTAEQFFNSVMKLAWEAGRAEGASATTTNQANKLAELARTQARLMKDAAPSS
jgi:uncharacterized protein (DUF2225 family)